MIVQSAWQLSFEFFDSKPVVVVPSAAQVSSDAGLLPFRQLDQRLGLSRQFAEALDTTRRVIGERGRCPHRTRFLTTIPRLPPTPPQSTPPPNPHE